MLAKTLPDGSRAVLHTRGCFSRASHFPRAPFPKFRSTSPFSTHSSTNLGSTKNSVVNLMASSTETTAHSKWSRDDTDMHPHPAPHPHVRVPVFLVLHARRVEVLGNDMHVQWAQRGNRVVPHAQRHALTSIFAWPREDVRVVSCAPGAEMRNYAMTQCVYAAQLWELGGRRVREHVQCEEVWFRYDQQMESGLGEPIIHNHTSVVFVVDLA